MNTTNTASPFSGRCESLCHWCGVMTCTKAAGHENGDHATCSCHSVRCSYSYKTSGAVKHAPELTRKGPCSCANCRKWQVRRARPMNTTTLPTPSFRRIQHAAHYTHTNRPGYTGPLGHDIDEWDVIAETQPTYDQKIAAGIPGDAEFHVGYFDKAGRHHWTFTKRAPFSESAACAHCRLRRG